MPRLCPLLSLSLSHVASWANVSCFQFNVQVSLLQTCFGWTSDGSVRLRVHSHRPSEVPESQRQYQTLISGAHLLIFVELIYRQQAPKLHWTSASMSRRHDITKPLMLAGKLPFRQAPPDTDGLPDLHLALYNEVVAFDQATKLAYICAWLHLEDFPTLEAAYLHGQRRLQALSHALESVDACCLSAGKVGRSLQSIAHCSAC